MIKSYLFRLDPSKICCTKDLGLSPELSTAPNIELVRRPMCSFFHISDSLWHLVYVLHQFLVNSHGGTTSTIKIKVLKVLTD